MDMNPMQEAKIITSVTSDKIRTKKVEWLWENRFPLGFITLLSGDPDTGKSCLSLFLASMVSTGGTWPDGKKCEQGKVFLLCGEDSASSTVVPRLMAMDADLKNIHQNFTKVGLLGGVEPINLGKDIFPFAETISKVGMIKLLIIDPLVLFLGNINSDNNLEVRQACDNLGRCAEEGNFAVVGIQHTRKSRQGKAGQNIMGSVAWNALARQVWFVARDEEDKSLFQFMADKHNLTREVTNLSFRLTSVDVKVSNGITNCPKVVFNPNPSKAEADYYYGEKQTHRKATQKAKAEVFLTNLFEERGWTTQIRSLEIYELAAKEGLSEDSVKLAKEILGIEAHNIHGVWYWWGPERSKISVESSYPY